MHQSLGGEGVSPTNEETARGYSLDVFVEAKVGEQVPREFRNFISGEWFRKALDQAERAVPVGIGNYRPAVYVEPPGGAQWLIVRL